MIRHLPVLAGVALASNAFAQDVSVDWSDLREGRPESCLSILAPLEDDSDCNQQTWVSRIMGSKIASCTPGNQSLNDRQIQIAVYAHPLEMEIKEVQDFLLTPPLCSDCRHPSPPPPDQVIRVHFSKGIDVSFDPVWVSGKLTLERAEHENAPSSYRMEATSVEPVTLIEVNQR